MSFTAQASVDHILDQKSQVKICFVHEKFTIKSIDAGIVKASPVDLKVFFEDAGFTGKKDSMVALPMPNGKKVSYVVFAGIGDQDETGHYCIELFRRALGSAVKYAKSRKGRGIIQANGYIHRQLQRMYSKHRIAALERM